jgi:predicted flavoprotein YhiN
VTGRSASREEFVTCGGVSLTSINRKTLESNSLPGLYFAGEILDTDALTGGYNLQAAWTTGFIAAMFK